MKKILTIVIGIVIIAGLFFLLRPQQQTQSPPNTSQVTAPPANQATSPSPTPESNVKIFELEIREKKIISGPATIKVKQGDEVTIKITSDETEEFHVHAYDNSVELEPNKQATLTFTANLSGRFPFELEKSKTELGALEVQPK